MATPSHKQASSTEMQPLLQLINQGNFSQAEILAKSMLEKYPTTFMLHNLLGVAYDAQTKYVDAIQCYQKALSIQNNLPDLHFNLGIALSNIGKLHEATASFRKAIALAPRFFEAYGSLGVTLQRLGDFDAAVANYQKGLAINPQDARGHFNMGTALRDQGKLDEAIKSYRQAIKLFPNYADAHCNLGETLRDQGKMDEAVQSYQAALALNPNHPNANYDMAEFLYLTKRYDEAINYFERAQLDDWQAHTLYCLYKAEKFDAFKSTLDQIVKTSRHTAPFIATLSTHYAINFGIEDPYNFCKNGFDFVYNAPIPELSEPDSPLLKQLLADIENTAIAERVQGMLHGGKQSAGNLFKRPETSFRTLGELVKKHFEMYKQQFANADCELIKSFPEALEFTSSWYVKMRQGGHLDAHIHEIGWISGAVYLAMPTQKQQHDEGAFEYGTHGDNYPQKHQNFPTGKVMPNVGDIVLFPSSLFHRTIPFTANEERICIAFDLRPANSIHRSSNY